MNKEEQHIYDLIKDIPDPEIPVLTIVDLGVIRKVERVSDDFVITITPTYTGCPAMNQFEDDILKTLKDNGVSNVHIETQYEPAWTTDWMSDNAKQKLQDYGIAPPQEKTSDKNYIIGKEKKKVICPQCKSEDTKMISQFGSTACKALYQCNNCKEPFDYFKCI
ncbi:1,2-phenylacetyl-CoA epoxidase subunit PaaD [Parvicella tangerina]|uniref:1,2-phenylacetyl-CoA epoxidase, subunit D n=1 Tax=Parvicella tangerina TaxID=2829795 RepID=A0A916JQM9_9FLAO|nr:1,2-phenylacetyl-CoA epoxidase subunit PaaD [Parvicella tangerina]CAG5087125.1 Putative 1,2-phenylacetyl-CoA epoxidase, subunit D [Parvicella tangerina]